MNNQQDFTGFAVQVLTGGLAAITAALLGSTLGVAGTVLGAGVASVVTTIAASVYLRSLQRVRVRVAGTQVDTPDEPRRRPRWPVLVTGTVLAFVLGMLAVTSVEWITGHRISGGQGTTIGGIVRPNSRPSPVERPNSSVPTTQPSLPTVTNTTPAPSTSDAPTTTSPPTSGSTTEPPPASNTTTGSAPTSQPPPSGAG
jgi:hypothetical protein